MISILEIEWTESVISTPSPIENKPNGKKKRIQLLFRQMAILNFFFFFEKKKRKIPIKFFLKLEVHLSRVVIFFLRVNTKQTISVGDIEVSPKSWNLFTENGLNLSGILLGRSEVRPRL